MSNPIKLLDVVVLDRDLPERQLVRGQVGTVVEIHGSDVFEIEFSDNQGRTYALLPLRSEDLLVLTSEPRETTASTNPKNEFYPWLTGN